MSRRVRYFTRLKHYVNRLLGLRNRTKFILAFVCINACLLLQLYANTHVYSNTYLGSQNVSGKSPGEIETILTNYMKLPYTVRVQNRSYTYSYGDLGVVIDNRAAHDLIFAPNRKPFPLNIALFMIAHVTTRKLTVPLTLTQNFNRFVEQTVFDFGVGVDNITFNPDAKTLLYEENQDKYRFDESYFIDLLRDRAGDNRTPLYPKLTKVVNIKESEIADTDTRIKNMYLSPLTVLVSVGGTTKSFILPEKELALITKVELSGDQTDVTVGVNADVFTKLITDHIKKINVLAQGNIVTPKVVGDMKDILLARYNNEPVDALMIDYDKGPNTDGTYADKYIEVDISQQKMFLFAKRKLANEYRVSTGRDYPTPTGEFKILNKSQLGYSSIYSVFMPWWMGFSYSAVLHAYFGIHELPYALVDGNKIQRPSSFLDAPNTGGCIALDVGAAQQVYAFADVGTPVVIYP